MKLSKKIITFIIAMACFAPLSVNAKEYYGVISGAEVRIRKAINKTDAYKFASSGEMFDMPDKNLEAGTSACPNGWYKVKYNGNIGYVCSDYLKVYEKQEVITTDGVEPTNDCQKEMQAAGFPSSYWTGLCTLKQAHPNWKFTAMTKDTNGSTIDWNMSVAAEASCGKNTISTSNAEYKNTSCNTATDSGYSPVSEKAVRFYMDPRNFLDEVNIFMFEKQDSVFNISSGDYQKATAKVFNNNFMAQQIPDLNYYIQRATEATGINNIAIASRIKQELGNGKATTNAYAGSLLSVISGDYTTRWNKYDTDGKSFDHYYNFFNVGVYDGSNKDAPLNGVRYAKNHGWGGTGNQPEDRITAITGGANFLKNSYANAGQNTIYFQKFNVYPNKATSRYLHQYMTNIQAPISEAKISYNAYRDAGLLGANFEFIIPVFAGMEGTSKPVEDGSSSSNDSSNERIGTDTMVVNSGYFYKQGGYMTKINPGTNVNDIKNSLQAVAGNEVKITNQDGNAVDGNIGTGYRIDINGETLIAIVYGDVSGDGQINALDLLKVQKQILNSAQLNGSFKEAADPSHDGQVNALDLLKVQKQILGSGNIEQ